MLQVIDVREAYERDAMPSSPVHHPIFARLWSLMSRHEPGEIRRHRDELLAGLSGRVIEVGAGAGSNFAHYPATVEEVSQWSPSRICASGRAPRLLAPTFGSRSSTASPTSLPAEDASFDAAVACSGPVHACRTRRARWPSCNACCGPSGELRFYEHVRSDRPALALSQRLWTGAFWPRAFGGCHTARDTPAAIAAAGSRWNGCAGCGSTRCRSHS